MTEEAVSTLQLFNASTINSLTFDLWLAQLLYRHALGEIAGFIDIAAEFDGKMICQEL